MNKKKSTPHCGAKRATEAAVLAVPSPPSTATWHPLSHFVVVDALERACLEKGLDVGRREYSLSVDGARVFGAWDISNKKEDDFGLVLGFRNSISRQFAIGFCAGLRIFAGDSLAFSSEFVASRLHTGSLSTDEISLMAVESLDLVLEKYAAFRLWYNALHETRLSIHEGLLLGTAAIRNNILPISRYLDFVDLLFAPGGKYERSLGGFHGAITEIYGGNSFLATQYKNLALNRFLDYEVPLLLNPDIVRGLGKGHLSFSLVKNRADCAFEDHARNSTSEDRPGAGLRVKVQKQIKEGGDIREAESRDLALKLIGEKP